MLPVIIISDHNENDIYLSVLKYHILLNCPNVQIFQYFVVFNNERLNASAAYILLNEHHFSENAIFFVETNVSFNVRQQKILLIKYNQKWILTPDSGIVGLLEKNKIKKIYFWKEYIQTSFYAKNEMLNALKDIVNNGFSISDNFKDIPYDKCKAVYWQEITERIQENGERRLILPLLYVDSYGNLIFKFKKEDFNQYKADYDISIKLPLGEKIESIHLNYNQADNNELLAIFNEAGYLEIASNGNYLAPLIAHKDIYSGISYPLQIILKPKK